MSKETATVDQLVAAVRRTSTLLAPSPRVQNAHICGFLQGVLAHVIRDNPAALKIVEDHTAELNKVK